MGGGLWLVVVLWMVMVILLLLWMMVMVQIKMLLYFPGRNLFRPPPLMAAAAVAFCVVVDDREIGGGRWCGDDCVSIPFNGTIVGGFNKKSLGQSESER